MLPSKKRRNFFFDLVFMKSALKNSKNKDINVKSMKSISLSNSWTISFYASVHILRKPSYAHFNLFFRKKVIFFCVSSQPGGWTVPARIFIKKGKENETKHDCCNLSPFYSEQFLWQLILPVQRRSDMRSREEMRQVREKKTQWKLAAFD